MQYLHNTVSPWVYTRESHSFNVINTHTFLIDYYTELTYYLYIAIRKFFSYLKYQILSCYVYTCNMCEFAAATGYDPNYRPCSEYSSLNRIHL